MKTENNTEKRLEKELKRLERLFKKLADEKNTKYTRASDVVSEYFGDDKYDIILLFEDYLPALIEKLDSKEQAELGRLLFGLSISEMEENDWEILYSGYGREIFELLKRLEDYEVDYLGVLLIFMSEHWLFAHALYEELKYQV